jgi:hypothetical protein
MRKSPKIKEILNQAKSNQQSLISGPILSLEKCSDPIIHDLRLQYATNLLYIHIYSLQGISKAQEQRYQPSARAILEFLDSEESLNVANGKDLFQRLVALTRYFSTRKVDDEPLSEAAERAYQEHNVFLNSMVLWIRKEQEKLFPTEYLQLELGVKESPRSATGEDVPPSYEQALKEKDYTQDFETWRNQLSHSTALLILALAKHDAELSLEKKFEYACIITWSCVAYMVMSTDTRLKQKVKQKALKSMVKMSDAPGGHNIIFCAEALLDKLRSVILFAYAKCDSDSFHIIIPAAIRIFLNPAYADPNDKSEMRLLSMLVSLQDRIQTIKADQRLIYDGGLLRDLQLVSQHSNKGHVLPPESSWDYAFDACLCVVITCEITRIILLITLAILGADF